MSYESKAKRQADALAKTFSKGAGVEFSGDQLLQLLVVGMKAMLEDRSLVAK